MKTSYMLIALLAAGCSSMTQKDERTWTHLKCSGSSAAWTDCWKEARALCPNGFDMANREEQRESLKREVDVACKR